ncbi:unnamed protein product [Leptosia nina]|uniref:Uncharacterized protein n=1 Tax=Leptosia nina TaxID=320188 RepID=A0AAV1J342_9NEOP
MLNMLAYFYSLYSSKKKGRSYTVRELIHDSFFDLKPLAAGNYIVTEDGEKWADIKVVQENRKKLLFKTFYDDQEFKSVSTFIKRQAKTNNVVTTTLEKIVFSKGKVSDTEQGILELIEKNVIPKYYEAFYSNL